MDNTSVISLSHVTKSFSGVTVLDDIDLTIHKGEIHALLGENGAGKSTLIKIIGGIYQPNAGEINFCGETVRIKNAKDAKLLGISIIHQEISLCPNLSVAANITLGNECSLAGTLSEKKNIEFARNALRQVDDSIDVYSLVSTLTIAQQQIVEIAKAIAYNAKLVIMDEPTSSLSDVEVKSLYKVVRRLSENGVAVLYVSHRMEEIFDLSNRITVLRDGKKIATLPTSEAEHHSLLQMLAGRELGDIYKRSVHTTTRRALEVRGMTQKGKFEDISLYVNSGEIVGLYGLVGAGRSEVAQAIYGIEKPDGGTVLLNNDTYRRTTVKKSMNRGLALIPENRKEQGIIGINTIKFNASLSILDRFTSPLGLRLGKISGIVTSYLQRLHVKMVSQAQLITSLSGGNQQKVVIAKILATEPSVLILDEPTRGIDVGAKAEIYALIDELAAKGVGILMISSELPEIVNMCDRVYVMCEGKMIREASGGEINQVDLLDYAIGGC